MANKKGIILKDGSMTTDPKIIAREEKNEIAKKLYGKKATYKMAGGKISKYYSAGGTVITGRD